MTVRCCRCLDGQAVDSVEAWAQQMTVDAEDVTTQPAMLKAELRTYQLEARDCYKIEIIQIISFYNQFAGWYLGSLQCGRWT